MAPFNRKRTTFYYRIVFYSNFARISLSFLCYSRFCDEMTLLGDCGL